MVEYPSLEQGLVLLELWKVPLAASIAAGLTAGLLRLWFLGYLSRLDK
jgi:hypothetical protein